MKQIRSKFTSKYVIAMFKALSDLVEYKPDFLKVFDQTSMVTKTSTHINNSIEHLLTLFTVVENSVTEIKKNLTKFELFSSKK